MNSWNNISGRPGISLYHDEFYNYMPSPDFIYSAFIFTQALADQEDITHIGIYVEENGGYLQLVDAEASNAVKKDFNEVLACGVPLDDVPAITTYKKKKEAHLRIKTDRGNEVARVEPLEIEGVEYYFVFYHESDKAVEGQASFIRNGIYWALGMAALAIIIGLTILRRMITLSTFRYVPATRLVRFTITYVPWRHVSSTIPITSHA